MRHRWSGWPGAWCLDCGCEDPNEVEVGTGRTVAPSHIGPVDCKEPGSKRHDPYAARMEKTND